MFTGEELLGHYLELHILHDTFNNLTSTSNLASKRLAYIPYIETCDQFDNIARTAKSRPEYLTYLKDLSDYLESFYRRTHPLYDLDVDLDTLYTEFETKWQYSFGHSPTLNFANIERNFGDVNPNTSHFNFTSEEKRSNTIFTTKS
ncbi:hypothetical protein MJO28_013452 [Puccinia striiformis f. sp. tritici]|uniref:SF3A3 domain-containing protein n=4 Tax=Puccinia striiformis TaxID=27350 RepID=A0A0L0VY36_9BASI|nr:hypothetical protein Pst134EA_024110 [Puccinia striiformis f. sp. tritici]KNF04097.1 hypothetical protein PSTG_02803 [Puccinia striiformis f. sp. tritici PST-78]POW10283.1 hypothetical protein PSTT_06167 [Puccinia striiformis]KAH9444524.1 hypothetical protein Pst134EB_024784 [Puccinia striiformis f. sp. tritici]KAH9453226.1 hypothetical protein Pst134EA_024110 [Puccinia striiformis f. sp. tritici]KAI7941167.1 hypothetical protein MJO28_013452 [Puccinia striiformis f. sp. tritici]